MRADWLGVDMDDFNFKSEWLYSELGDQSGEKYWALDNWIDKYKKIFSPFILKSIAYVSRSPTLPLLLYKVIL